MYVCMCVCSSMMKDRKKRSVLSGGVILLWCTLAVVFVFGFAFSTRRLFFTESSQPRLITKWNFPATEAISEASSVIHAITIRETVIFPDQALVFLNYPRSAPLSTKDDISCVYLPRNSSKPQQQLELSPPLSLEVEHGNQQIVRCRLPPRGRVVSVAIKGNGKLVPGPTHRWDSLAYEAVLDRDNTTIVFVKGLNLRSGRAADPSKFKCLYGWNLTNANFVLWADAVFVAQEIVRCRTPLSVLNSLRGVGGGDGFDGSIKVSVRVVGRRTLRSVARVRDRLPPKRASPDRQHKMCVCTMLRNQARFLREWIMYHSRVGVERWFIYDNNSDDDIEHVVESLNAANYNVTRRLWPWIKTQEAGFAHCALRARDSCDWVGFIDVDEFFRLPSNFSLHDIIGNNSRPSDVGELRVSCHSFGPSGLKSLPMKGVMAGYTCRMARPERHKSIVKPEALNSSLMNMVHHFHLAHGYRYMYMNRSALVINHYKYQVWEVFKEKFYRRVATYVSDWQQERNVGSKDRAPGLGTKAVEPSDWSTRFCEVKDTGLRDWVLETFADRKTGLLPWEHQLNVGNRGSTL